MLFKSTNKGMSNVTKRTAQKIKATKLLFPMSMYNTPHGSLIVSSYILSKDKDNFPLTEVCRKWRELEKNPGEFKQWIDSPEFINYTFKFFGVKRPLYFPVAMVQGEFLPLFAPYVNNAIFPLREDGFMGPTLKHGKIYPIEWEL